MSGDDPFTVSRATSVYVAPRRQSFESVREQLAHPPDSAPWEIHHIDITCDGCEQEPIIGPRYTCSVCHDRDLCQQCMDALMEARARCQAQTGRAPGANVAALKAKTLISWARELRDAGDEAERWARLAEAVPCLDPKHVFRAVTAGPEREVCLRLPTATGAQNDALESFLSLFPPSACSCADIAWVSVVVSRPESAARSPAAVEQRVRRAVAEWEALGLRRPTTPEDAAALAARFDLRRGKWLLFPRRGAEATAAWTAVARACVAGRLGDEVKISAVPAARSGRGTHVVCAYTRDYLDRADVDRVRDALGALGLRLGRRHMTYKPDIHTYLGVYGGGGGNRPREEAVPFLPSVYKAELPL